VPVVRIVDNTRHPDRELAMHISGALATMPPETPNTLHLSCEAEAVLAMDVDLVVPPLVVRHGGSDFYATATTQHEDLGVLLLGDESLLDQADWHTGTNEMGSGLFWGFEASYGSTMSGPVAMPASERGTKSALLPK